MLYIYLKKVVINEYRGVYPSGTYEKTPQCVDIHFFQSLYLNVVLVEWFLVEFFFAMVLSICLWHLRLNIYFVSLVVFFLLVLSIKNGHQFRWYFASKHTYIIITNSLNRNRVHKLFILNTISKKIVYNHITGVEKWWILKCCYSVIGHIYGNCNNGNRNPKNKN